MYNLKRSRITLGIITYGLLFFLTFSFLFPFLWTVATSFKPIGEWYHFEFLPKKPTLRNYYEVFFPRLIKERIAGEAERGKIMMKISRSENIMIKPLANSLVVTGFSVLLSLVIGIPTAYALSRFKFLGGKQLALGLITTWMVPPLVVIIPLFFVIRGLGLMDTHLGLIIPYVLTSIPFAVWILKGTFDSIPTSMEDAAMMDGCNLVQVWMKVIFPVAIGGIGATALFCAFISWNELIFALALSQENTKTLPVALADFITYDRGISVGPLCATVTVASLPIIGLVYFFQRYMVRGLASGALR